MNWKHCVSSTHIQKWRQMCSSLLQFGYICTRLCLTITRIEINDLVWLVCHPVNLLRNRVCWPAHVEKMHYNILGILWHLFSNTNSTLNSWELSFCNWSKLFQPKRIEPCCTDQNLLHVVQHFWEISSSPLFNCMTTRWSKKLMQSLPTTPWLA